MPTQARQSGTQARGLRSLTVSGDNRSFVGLARAQSPGGDHEQKLRHEQTETEWYRSPEKARCANGRGDPTTPWPARRILLRKYGINLFMFNSHVLKDAAYFDWTREHWAGTPMPIGDFILVPLAVE